MRIRKLVGRDFRRYRTFDIELAPGLTVIRGPNEAGKTTVQRALELALTKRATSTAAELEALRPWGAPADARSIISVDFEQDEEDGLHTGTLEKTFAGARGTVRLDYEGQSITDPAMADQVMAELTGMPTEGFFRSTASVHHFELSDLSRDEGALRDRLQASISGADRGTSRARKKLDKALHDLNTRGDRNPGRLKLAELAVEQSKAALDQGELALAQLERDRDSLAGARERRADAETALAERRSLLEKARQAERIMVDRDAATERYERYRQAVEVDIEIQQLANTHPSATPLPVLRSAVERLRTLDGKIRELRAALSGEVRVDFEVAPEPTWQPLSRLAIALVVVGLIIVGLPVLLKFIGVADVGVLVQVVGALVALVGVVMAAVALWLRRSYTLQTQMRDVEIDRRLRGRSEMEAELRDAEAKAEGQLGSLGLTDLAEAEDLLSREEQHVGQIERLTGQLEGLVGKEPTETLPTLRDAAALEIAQKTSALEALGPIAKEPRARERLEVEVRDQEGALERSRDDEANARARVEANTVDAEQVAGQAERLAAWREQLSAAQRRQRVFAATLAAIDRAEQATMKTATRYLESHMVRDLATVTGGRYRRVRVDDRTLDIEVFAPEKNDWVPVSSLSQGTLDLVYLVARLGLVRLVTGDRRPPLVFDDPFVTLDDTRAARALGLLKSVASDFQVIYLTTSARYDEAADAVVVLDGPTSVDSAAPLTGDPGATGASPADVPAATGAAAAGTGPTAAPRPGRRA
ncbi:MAG TPA: AAA family ATPase [Candidatus Limnocylindrales bacterium]|nr:AAA family ATPase [Candidatus Limnocylindrales bacterium]